MISVKITFYQDTRKPKANGKYPVRFRIYFQGRTRYFPVDLRMTEKEFQGATATNPRKNYLEYPHMKNVTKEAGVTEEITTYRSSSCFYHHYYAQRCFH